MNSKQEERLVASWEAIAAGLGALNETFRSAISKQWPDAKERRDAVVTRLLTPEDKLKAQTGNTAGPLEEWLEKLESEEDEPGPREKDFLARQKQSASAKASAKARGPKGAGA